MVSITDIREWVRQSLPAPADSAAILGWLDALAATDGVSRSCDVELDDVERIDLLDALESLKSAAAAAQARVTVAFDASQRHHQAASGMPAEKVGAGIAEQVALARRESPTRGSRHLGLARALVREMPNTHQALTDGVITEWAATLVVQATACLSVADRAAVDAALATRMGELSDVRLGKAAQALAYQADPAAWIGRGRRAAGDRRVSVRPAPDVMALVTGYVPGAQGVACFKALDEHARAVKAEGDDRTLDQIKADTFVQRLTGQATAGAVPVEIQLVMTDAALLAGDSTPARLEGYGPLPAGDARDLVTDDVPTCASTEDRARCQPGDELDVWVRRLYTDPATGELAGIDHTRRRFGAQLRRFIDARDQVCTTKWCGAPIRHRDHAIRRADGGPTDAINGRATCERCNYAKEAPGWSTQPITLPGGHRALKVTTPTGHTYYHQPPPVLDTRAHAPTQGRERSPTSAATLDTG